MRVWEYAEEEKTEQRHNKIVSKYFTFGLLIQ